MLQLHNVTHFYGDRLIFKDISFTLKAGSVTLLAGPNGAGKSTLLAIAAGLISPVTGSITLRNPNLRIAMLSHQSFLYPEMTALENLLFWSSVHQVPSSKEDVFAILSQVNLDDFALEKSKTFSRGMAQRLSLARVLLIKPDIMLLDEPGTGLDTASSIVLHQEIDNARKRGIAILWVSHSLKNDISLADNIVFLKDGCLQYNGNSASFQPLIGDKHSIKSTKDGLC